MLLRDKLFPEGEATWRPLIVRCANCEMTMWATSENAHVDANGKFIYCSDCLGVSKEQA